jgi:hypothetical protein
MQGHHRSAGGMNHLHGSFSVVGVFSRERQRGFATHASARARDDAHLSCKSV